MRVLAGCGFLPSVPGVGIARTHNLGGKSIGTSPGVRTIFDQAKVELSH